MVTAKWLAEALRQARTGSIAWTHMREINVQLQPYTLERAGDILKLNQPDGSATAWKVIGEDAAARTSIVVQVPVSA